MDDKIKVEVISSLFECKLSQYPCAIIEGLTKSSRCYAKKYIKENINGRETVTKA